MKLLKKLFGIKTTYAIPSDNGVDITKGKKYKLKDGCFIKDNNGIEVFISLSRCNHFKGGNWQIIIE